MSHTLEITILSAENLSMNKKSLEGNALFVSLQSDSSNDIYSTNVDSSEGGGTRNEKLVMELPLDARFITAEVKCKASKGTKSVGMARIPVSDLVGHHVHQDQVQFLSYRLWDSKVERNGVINVSVRVKVPEYAFPVMGMPVAGGGSNGVVTGIPAWLSYQGQL